MTTFATLYGNVQTYINRTDLTTQVKDAINRSIEYYSRRSRFWFNETTSTFSTVAAQESYGTGDGIPSDLLRIDNLQVQVNSSYNEELIPRTYEYIQIANATSSATGIPYDYCFYEGKIYLSPIPNAVYTIDISYLKSYSDLSADSDTNDFTDNAEDLIEARACWWMYSRMLRNTEAAQASKADEQEALGALKNQTNRLIASNRVRPTQF